MKATDMVKQFAINVSLLFSSLLILYAGAEAIARVIDCLNPPPQSTFKYIPRPDGRQPTSFRKSIPAYAPHNGTTRIVAFGDSYTWGAFVRDPEDIWTSVLEKDLVSSLPGRYFEVVNLGLRGFTTVNELELFSTLGIKLRPDVVIIQFTLNDPLPSAPHFVNKGENWIPDMTRDIVSDKKIHDKIESISFFYRFMNIRFKDLQYKLTATTRYDPLFEDDFSGWINCRKCLNAFANVGRQKGIRTALMLFPVFKKGRWNEDNYPYRKIHAKVIEAARQCGLEALDLTPVFVRQKKDFSSWGALNGADCHPGEEAQKIAGDALAEFLIKKHIVS